MTEEYKLLKSEIATLRNLIDMMETEVTNLTYDMHKLSIKIDKMQILISDNTVVTNPFIRNVLNKIQILKNLITSKMPEGEFISLNLSEVENLEASIVASNNATTKQLTKLNEIYNRVNTQ